MNKLEIARKNIDDIDLKMMELFKQRMNEVGSVLEYKKANHLPVFDAKREEMIKQSKGHLFNDDKLKPYYDMFFEELLRISRKFQEDHYE